MIYIKVDNPPRLWYKKKVITNHHRERGEYHYESVLCKKPCNRKKIHNQRNGTGWNVCSSPCSNITDFTANADRSTDHHLGIWRSTCRSSTWFQTWNYRNTGLRSVRSHRTSDRINHQWFTVAFCRRFHEHSGNRSIFLNCIYPKRHCDHSSRSPDRDSDQKRNQQCRKPLITVSSQRIARWRTTCQSRKT